MGDLVRTDEAGRLWFCGRKSHRVTTAETTLFPVAWELMFNAHEAVKRSALVGIGLPGNQEPVLCVEPKRRLSRRERETLTRELSALAAAEVATRSIRRIVFLRDFPVDPRHNAKILRERLAERVQEEER
jgi:acyl-coenzyme A synthetase/AMP-(fatty) acid ligase